MRRSILWLPLLLGASLTLAGAAAVPPANLAKALDAQRALVAERPQDERVYNDLGNLLILSGKSDEAEPAYRKAIELAPDKTSAHFNLGLLLEQKGAWREALAELRKAAEIAPRDAWTCYQLGALYEAHKLDSQAVEWYARAFALDPQLVFPEVNPGIIDSRLVTEALLRSYQTSLGQPLAPKSYGEPGRIAALLVPPVKPVETGQELPADEQGTEAAEGTRQRQPKVLTDKNIKHGGSVGQATPSATGGASAYPIRQGGVRTRATAIAAPRFEPPPAPSEVGPRLDIGVPLTRQPDQGAASKRGNGQHNGRLGVVVPGFQPGLQSTGRLEIRLVPESAETAPAG